MGTHVIILQIKSARLLCRTGLLNIIILTRFQFIQHTNRFFYYRLGDAGFEGRAAHLRQRPTADFCFQPSLKWIALVTVDNRVVAKGVYTRFVLCSRRIRRSIAVSRHLWFDTAHTIYRAHPDENR
jgi:hypothetical protein